jgi:hypothetical protein
MAEEQVTLEGAIEMARRLSSSEQLKLREELDQMIVDPTEADSTTEPSEADFSRRLLESGLITEVRLGQTPTYPQHKYAPVPVEGKPVSQTIIEDRR